VTGGWRKLHNEELHNLYYSRNIIRMINTTVYENGRGGGARTVHTDEKFVKILLENPEETTLKT
jgi:hypothetical protein